MVKGREYIEKLKNETLETEDSKLFFKIIDFLQKYFVDEDISSSVERPIQFEFDKTDLHIYLNGRADKTKGNISIHIGMFGNKLISHPCDIELVSENLFVVHNIKFDGKQNNTSIIKVYKKFSKRIVSMFVFEDDIIAIFDHKGDLLKIVNYDGTEKR